MSATSDERATLVKCPVCCGDCVTLRDRHSDELYCSECAGQGVVDPEDYGPGEYRAIRYGRGLHR
jgi:hypothetical protein